MYFTCPIGNALTCCQNWMRNTALPINLQEAMDKVETINEEIESGNLSILYLYVQFFINFLFTFLFIY
jgi:hypothetical protein